MQASTNDKNNVVDIGNHVGVCDTQEGKSLPAEPKIAKTIMINRLPRCVRCAFECDHQARFVAVEIAYVHSNRMLSSKFHPKLAISYRCPKNAFRNRRFATKPPCLLNEVHDTSSDGNPLGLLRFRSLYVNLRTLSPHPRATSSRFPSPAKRERKLRSAAKRETKRLAFRTT